MTDTVKLIIEIPKEDFKKLVNPYQHNEVWCNRLKRMVMHGTPLEDVKAEIKEIAKDYDKFADYRRVRGLWTALDILDNIGKAESEEQ